MLAVGLLFIISSLPFAQVKIKERVEIKTKVDSAALFFPGQGFDHRGFEVSIINAEKINNIYYLDGYSTYQINFKILHYYTDYDLNIHRDVWEPPEYLRYTVYFHGYNGTGYSMIISDIDTCSEFGNIPKGFKLLAGNEFNGELLGLNEGYSNLYLCLETWIGAYRYSENIPIAIRKTHINMEFLPSNLMASDTAQIIINKQLQNGTIIPFDNDQLFEIGIFNGCEYGKIILQNGDDSVYFNKVKQPFRFVVSDTIDVDSIEVKLKLGVSSNSFNVNYLSKSNQFNNSTGSAPTNPYSINSSCPLNFVSFNFAEESAWIKKKYCDDWKCSIEPMLPKIDVKEINYGNGTDKQKTEIKKLCVGDWGFFLPLWDGPLIEQPINVEPCFKETWQFNYITNPLWLDAYVVFCPDCVNKGWILENLSDVWRIPEDQLCAALADFKAQRSYGASVTYKIKKATMVHERLHKNDFFAAISKTLYKYPDNSVKKYNTLLVNTGWDCDQVKNYDNALYKMQYYLSEKIAEFSNKIKTEFYKRTEVNNYEIGLWDTVEEIQDIIKDYIEEIQKRINATNKNRSENLKIKCK